MYDWCIIVKIIDEFKNYQFRKFNEKGRTEVWGAHMCDLSNLKQISVCHMPIGYDVKQENPQWYTTLKFMWTYQDESFGTNPVSQMCV